MIFFAKQKELLLSGFAPVFTTGAITNNKTDFVSAYYKCVLSGTPDLIIPISAFQIRLTADPYRATINITIPGADLISDEIVARSSGTISISIVYNYIDGTNSEVLISSSTFDNISISETPGSGTTITLSGYYETTRPSISKKINITKIVSSAKYNDQNIYRFELDPTIKPNDIAIIDGVNILISEVLITVGLKSSNMEIKELINV
jgi:hypothetical protein